MSTPTPTDIAHSASKALSRRSASSHWRQYESKVGFCLAQLAQLDRSFFLCPAAGPQKGAKLPTSEYPGVCRTDVIAKLKPLATSIGPRLCPLSPNPGAWWAPFQKLHSPLAFVKHVWGFLRATTTLTGRVPYTPPVCVTQLSVPSLSGHLWFIAANI